MALVLAPTDPLDAWFSDLDEVARRSPGFFGGRAIIVDLSAIRLSKAELKKLVGSLHERDIRVMGIEGADPAMLDLGMPPSVNGGRPAGAIEAPNATTAPVPPPAPAKTLLVETSVRSGQSILHADGDVTIVGSVASGAEVVAGGSIHIYGTLRGRAIAGCTGDARARIFCSKFEAELISIDGLYKTADDLGPAFRGLAVQVNLDGDSIILKTFD
ncbi:septum site-determining protein MinC [Microvirga brassicacearum]|uniref:Probable septum site-determining protein MinC n=1 Tax=Microvirga brassicacearum TaxID=2580413 RepID=A0A5N3PFX9_9HYPH|nr:septum site-determining protein MinC [Microvirga brassicacearum]KAB0268652.1 septum formation inhibitor MinC [Microvirga brassicacearum]